MIVKLAFCKIVPVYPFIVIEPAVADVSIVIIEEADPEFASKNTFVVAFGTPPKLPPAPFDVADHLFESDQFPVPPTQ